jgi:hypoxanthine phosphoribosyltransferase
MTEMRVIFSEDTIAQRVEELAQEINAWYAQYSEPVVAICVLKGAVVFFADLIRKLDMPLEIDFLRVASYGDKMHPGQEISFSKKVESDLTHKHVLLVEDIVDTGFTIQALLKYLWEAAPLSVRVCALIHKTERRMVQVPVDHLGFHLSKGFIVGYGLDYAEKYRQLTGIYEICNEI